MTVAADQDRLPYFEHQQNAQVGCKQFLEERAWPSDENLCALERTLWQMSCVHGYEHHGSRSDERRAGASNLPESIGWPEERLVSIVTRDSMIGVARL